MEYFDIRTIFNKKQKKMEYFEEIAQEVDGRIPKNIAEILIKENNNPNYTIAIHRESMHSPEELFKNGLAIAGGNDIDYTTSRYKSDFALLVNINGASGYKNPFNEKSSCLIIKLPNTALNYEPGKTKPILLQTDNCAEIGSGTAVIEGKYQTVLLPEYILGAIEYENGMITGFKQNENYREIHDYKNDGLVCTSDAIYSYIEKNDKNLYKTRELSSLTQEINERIINENNEYESNNVFQPRRDVEEIKTYAQKGMRLSRFKETFTKFKKVLFGEKENIKNNENRE